MFNFISTTQWIFNRIWSREGQPHIVKLSFALRFYVWVYLLFCWSMMVFCLQIWITYTNTDTYPVHNFAALFLSLALLMNPLPFVHLFSLCLCCPPPPSSFILVYIAINIASVANTSEGMQNCFVSVYYTKKEQKDWLLHIHNWSHHVLFGSCILFSRSPCAFWSKKTLCLRLFYLSIFIDYFFYLSYTDLLARSVAHSRLLPFRLVWIRLWIGYITLYHLFIADVIFFPYLETVLWTLQTLNRLYFVSLLKKIWRIEKKHGRNKIRVV